eukprot:6181082-Pleurochrysis_carterae.AAC.3
MERQSGETRYAPQSPSLEFRARHKRAALNRSANRVDCIASVHSSFLDKAEASYPRAVRSSTQEIDLSELPRNADGALNATQVECLLSSPPYGEASVLLISLKAGDTLPPLAGLREEAQRRADTFFTGKCTVHKALYDAASFAAASQEKLNASLAAMRADVASGSRGLLYQLNRKAAGKQLGWIVKGRQELGLSTELSEAQRIDVRKHLRAWQSASSLARDMAEAPVRPSSPVRTTKLRLLEARVDSEEDGTLRASARSP